jgi:RimJ/RimL family protein N-acetyltransferase
MKGGWTMAEIDPTTLLRGTLVDLRPLEADDASLLHRWANDPATAGAFDATQPRTLASVERQIAKQRTLTDKGGELMIVRKDGTPVGTVQCRRVRYGRYSLAVNVGIQVAPDQRGHGYGSEAQRLLADYLLFTFPIGRVEASTDVENIPEQRALEKAGFTREGAAPARRPRGDRLHDMVVYSRVRDDV